MEEEEQIEDSIEKKSESLDKEEFQPTDETAEEIVRNIQTLSQHESEEEDKSEHSESSHSDEEEKTEQVVSTLDLENEQFVIVPKQRTISGLKSLNSDDNYQLSSIDRQTVFELKNTPIRSVERMVQEDLTPDPTVIVKEEEDESCSERIIGDDCIVEVPEDSESFKLGVFPDLTEISSQNSDHFKTYDFPTNDPNLCNMRMAFGSE